MKELLQTGWRWARRALIAFGILFAVVTLTPLVSWWSLALAGPWTEARGDVLIVLGGSELQDGMIGLNSYWRSVYATWAIRDSGFRDVIVSGGSSGSSPIANSIRQFIVCQGAPAALIRVETASQSTRENALFTARMLEGLPGRKVLLTSDYHMFRAVRAFRKAGVDVLPRPFPDAGKMYYCWSCRWPAFLILSGESVKIAYYYVRGWI